MENKYITNSELVKFLQLLKEKFPKEFEAWDIYETQDCNSRDYYDSFEELYGVIVFLTIEAPYFDKEKGYCLADNEQQPNNEHYITLSIGVYDIEGDTEDADYTEFTDAQLAIDYIVENYVSISD